ncbi:mechanosensitive ion channel family protein, partial [Chloroflexota bacterium]
MPQFVLGSPLLEVLWVSGLFVASILIAYLVLLGMRCIRRRLEKRSRTTLTPKLLQCFSKPIFLLIIFLGLLLALYSLPSLVLWRSSLENIAIAVTIILVTYTLARSGGLLLSWHLYRKRIRQSLVRLVQRIVILVVSLVGLIMLLDYLGISISPLIAGLGIGGLAVALALQPTLSNFFAGTQLVLDRMIHIGDYIELDSGERGYVADVGWRSTRVRTTFNNIMVIPNSRLVDSIITNYYGPSMELAVMVESGVSYSSD